ncbi:MAG: hypothetical protein H6551_06245 [Chitinophagales bacterium]|nr:hypothetical protein [Chitinophagales bacterium]
MSVKFACIVVCGNVSGIPLFHRSTFGTGNAQKYFLYSTSLQTRLSARTSKEVFLLFLFLNKNSEHSEMCLYIPFHAMPFLACGMVKNAF